MLNYRESRAVNGVLYKAKGYLLAPGSDTLMMDVTLYGLNNEVIDEGVALPATAFLNAPVIEEYFPEEETRKNLKEIAAEFLRMQDEGVKTSIVASSESEDDSDDNLSR